MSTKKQNAIEIDAMYEKVVNNLRVDYEFYSFMSSYNKMINVIARYTTIRPSVVEAFKSRHSDFDENNDLMLIAFVTAYTQYLQKRKNTAARERAVKAAQIATTNS